MNGLISLLSKALNLNASTPEYTISDGSRVAIIGTEILTHNIIAGKLGTVRGFSKYPMRVEPMVANPPLITHAIVEFPAEGSGLLKFAVPVSSLRTPTFGESLTGIQTLESYAEYAKPQNLIFQFLPKPISRITSEVQEILYGLIDTKIYSLEVEKYSTDFQEVGRQLRKQDIPKVSLYDALSKGDGGNSAPTIKIDTDNSTKESKTVPVKVSTLEKELQPDLNGVALSEEVKEQITAKIEESPISVPTEPKPSISVSASVNPLLSWDMGEEDSPSGLGFSARQETPVSDKPVEIVIKAPPVVTEAILESTGMFASAPASSNAPKANPNFVPKTKEELLETAKRNIGMLDREAGIAELEGAGARVQVDDKAMINCRADLNQLVPFKYDWMWQAYLKGTENHWMPLEINILNDIVDWENCTPGESKLIQFALYTLEIHSNFFTNDPLLAIYRFLTNPEARQYILRQRFEVTVWGNFVHNLMDNFDYQFPITEVPNAKTGKVVQQCDWYSFNDKNYKSFLQRDQIATKLQARKRLLAYVGDNEFEPKDNVQDKMAIIERVVLYYVCGGLIYNFASLIQLIGLGNTERDIIINPETGEVTHRKIFAGVSSGASLILRDVALHTSAGCLIIKQILAENPDVCNDELFARMINIIQSHCDIETEYMDWWANEDVPNAKSSSQIQTLQYMVNRITEDLGFGRVYENVARVPECPWFVTMFDNYTPTLHGGGSSVLGSGGALTF